MFAVLLLFPVVDLLQPSEKARKDARDVMPKRVANELVKLLPSILALDTHAARPGASRRPPSPLDRSQRLALRQLLESAGEAAPSEESAKRIEWNNVSFVVAHIYFSSRQGSLASLAHLLDFK